MKILVVCQLYYPENFVITNIAEELVKFGHDVTVLTGKPNYGFGEILPEYKNIKYQEINGVKIHRVKLVARSQSRISTIKNYLSFWKNSKKWVKKCKEKYDIVFSMSLSPVTILSAGNLYKKLHHTKHVVYCVDLWPESVLVTNAVKKNSLFYKFIYIWSKKLYQKADEIIIGSPSFKEYFAKVLNLGYKPFSYIPQPSLVEGTSEENYVYEKPFNILYCGNLGLIQLIPLIPEAMKDLDGVAFHIIGMGPLTNNLISKIDEYHLEEKIFYHGPITAKRAAAYFTGADALYVSLKSEGYVGKTIPNKLVMAMAFAKPIIAVLDGDGKKVLEESKGAVFASENAESLKNAILKLKQMNKAQKEAMGQANRQYFLNEFTLDNVCKKIEKILLNNVK